MNDILGSAGKAKRITSHDIPKIKHECIKAYGLEWWRTADLDEVFEQLPLIQEDYNKAETLRLQTLRYYGIKNPK